MQKYIYCIFSCKCSAFTCTPHFADAGKPQWILHSRLRFTVPVTPKPARRAPTRTEHKKFSSSHR